LRLLHQSAQEAGQQIAQVPLWDQVGFVEYLADVLIIP
jgi:hypothetical protein